MYTSYMCLLKYYKTCFFAFTFFVLLSVLVCCHFVGSRNIGTLKLSKMSRDNDHDFFDRKCCFVYITHTHSLIETDGMIKCLKVILTTRSSAVAEGPRDALYVT